MKLFPGVSMALLALVLCEQPISAASYEDVYEDYGYEETEFTSYSQLLRNVPAEYYYLFDFDQDGDDELLIWSMVDYAYQWAVYGKESGKICRIAESCSEKPGNAGHSLEILDNGCIKDSSDRGLVGYDAEWTTYIYREEDLTHYLHHFSYNEKTYENNEVNIVASTNGYWMDGSKISEPEFSSLVDGLQSEEETIYLNEDTAVMVTEDSISALAEMEESDILWEEDRS